MNNLEEFEAEQKKKRRLARNRESARECRKRKKEYGEVRFISSLYSFIFLLRLLMFILLLLGITCPINSFRSRKSSAKT